MLGGCELGDLQAAFNITTFITYYIVEEVIDAINVSINKSGIPTDIEELCRLSHTFKTSRKYLNPLTGRIPAIEGIYVKIEKPKYV